jgi:hypothetical protein
MTITHIHTFSPLNVILVLAAIYIAGSFVVPLAELIEHRIRGAWESFKAWRKWQ